MNIQSITLHFTIKEIETESEIIPKVQPIVVESGFQSRSKYNFTAVLLNSMLSLILEENI